MLCFFLDRARISENLRRSALGLGLSAYVVALSAPRRSEEDVVFFERGASLMTSMVMNICGHGPQIGPERGAFRTDERWRKFNTKIHANLAFSGVYLSLRCLPRVCNLGFQTVVRDCRLSRGKSEVKKRLKRVQIEVKMGRRNFALRTKLEPPFGNHRLQTLGFGRLWLQQRES